MVHVRAGMRPGAALIVVVTALVGGACAAGGGESGARQAPAGDLETLFGARRARVLFPNGRVFLVEVADTPAERARGLMYRERLEPDAGMVFVFEEPGLHSFWMKNTRVSLDIVWLDRQGGVVHIERGVPPCIEETCPGYEPLRLASGVLEVAAGQAESLKLGQTLLVVPEPAPGGP